MPTKFNALNSHVHSLQLSLFQTGVKPIQVLFLIIALTFYGSTLLAQPIISVNTGSLSATIGPGSTSTQQITITNNGISTLNWAVDFTNLFGSGYTTDFEKVDFADWTLEPNQDRLSDDIWITRDDVSSIFNGYSESAYNAGTSPEGTEWAVGNVNGLTPGDYQEFVAAHGGDPNTLIGVPTSMHLINDDRYYNILFTSYSGGGPGGGFAYTRNEEFVWMTVSQTSGALAPLASVIIDVTLGSTDLLAPGVNNGSILIDSDDPVTPQTVVTTQLTVQNPAFINLSAASLSATLEIGTSSTQTLSIQNLGTADLDWSIDLQGLDFGYGSLVSFSKVNSADWTLPENQDQITPNVIITRANSEGIFNIAQETGYDRNGGRLAPTDTEWSYGETTPDKVYTSWVSAVGYYPPGSVGQTYSMHLITDDIYYDIEFLSWSSGGSGGGFSYNRSLRSPWLLADISSNTLPSGFADVITFTFDATDFNLAGQYSFDLEIVSNDPTKPSIIIPISLVITGDPEISGSTSVDFGDGFIGSVSSIPYLISNPGASDLVITGISSNNAEFSTITNEATILPGQDLEIALKYIPVTTGPISGTLSIASNDPDTPVLAVAIAGNGALPPEMVISSYSLTESLTSGTTGQQQLTISNTGASDLEFSIQIDGARVFDLNGAAVGPNVTFTIVDGADPTLPANQDIITPNVAITRANTRGLYNAALESSYTHGISPMDTEWAFGNSGNVQPTDYTDWRSSFRNNFQTPNLVGNTLALHLITDDLYYDVDFLAWTQGSGGGGFSYKRTQVSNWITPSVLTGTVVPGGTAVIDIDFEATYLLAGMYNASINITSNVPTESEISVGAELTVTGVAAPEISLSTTTLTESLSVGTISTQSVTLSNIGPNPVEWSLDNTYEITNLGGTAVTFTKLDFADPLLVANQDVITPNVAITRGDSRGLYNILSESSYNYGSSPAGTRWALGATTQGQSYSDWRSVAYPPFELPGKTLSMYLTAEDQFYDVEFLQWTGGIFSPDGGGGGFSYTRTERLKTITILSPESGTLNPGESVIIDVQFDANIIGGNYLETIDISTDVPLQSQLQVAIDFTVIGIPDINTTALTHIFSQDAFVNEVITEQFEIINSGTDDLIVSDLVSSLSEFEFSETSFTVPGSSSYFIDISFSPISYLGAPHAGNFTISSNDPDSPLVGVAVSANALLPPDISVTPSSLSANLFSANTFDTDLTIENTGSSDLAWNIYYVISGTTPVTFTKDDYADPSLVENQDAISSNVIITRGDNRGLYNVAIESGYTHGISPTDTEWSFGATVQGQVYYDWRQAVGYNPPSQVGNTYSLHTITDDQYFDITFNSWTSNNNGGGFSYTRIQAASWIVSSALNGTIIPGATEVVTITFDAGSLLPGTYLADIIIETNIPLTPSVTVLTQMDVTGIPDLATISNIDFGDGFLQGSELITVDITNQGGLPLTVSSITSNIPEITIVSSIGTLDPQSTETIDIIFTPTVVQLYSATITVNSDDPVTPAFTFTASGNGISGPIINVTPASISETVLSGGALSRSITIQNTGTSDLNWNLVSVVDPNVLPVTFTKVDYADPTLPENQDRITSNVWITRDDNQGMYNAVTENGYTYNVSPSDTEWAYGPTYSAGSYNEWRVVTRPYHSNMNGQIFSLHLITDDLYYDVEFHDWTRSNQGGGFSYTRTLVPSWVNLAASSGTVIAGSSEVVDLILEAGSLAAGTHEAEMLIGSNIGFETESVFITLDVLGNPEIELPESDLPYGSILVGQTETLSLTINNIGSDILNITSFSFSDPEFSIAESSLSIEAGGLTELIVNFDPAAEIAYAGTMTITSDDPLNPSEIVSLSGTGILPPIISVDATELRDVIFFGQSTTKSFIIQNTGSTDLEWELAVAPDPITFTKLDYADWTLEENQDRITDNVWITRADDRGLFNIVLESQYDRSADDGPLDTEWAYGLTENVNSADYATWRSATRSYHSNFDGEIFSMHLITDDLYYDVEYHDWTTDGNGGAFSYTRTQVLGQNPPPWVEFSSTSGVINPGGSKVVTVSFNPLGQLEGDFAMENLIISSNDALNGQYPIPASLTITGIMVDNPVASVVVNEGFISHMEDLSAVFLDAQGDALSYSVTSSNAAAVTASVLGSDLTFDEFGIGTSDIIITADDGKGNTATTELTFRVNAVPTVVTGLADQLESPGFGTLDIDISSTFTDADPADILAYSALSDDDAITTVAISAGILTLTEVVPGVVTITVTADDGFGGTVSTSFAFTTNNPPVVDVLLPDLTLSTGYGSTDIDVISTFSDLDGDALTFTASSGDVNIATTSVTGTVVTVLEGTSVGTVTISVTADDGFGGTVTDDFDIFVNTVPGATGPIADVFVNEGFVTSDIDISSLFTDVEGDAMTYTATSSDEGVVTVAVSGTTTTITEVGYGTSTITILATDANNGIGTYSFDFRVNSLPVVSPIPDQNLTVGFGSNTLPLPGFFTDADGDVLSFSASTTNSNVVSFNIIGTDLKLYEEGTGTATITVTANDGNTGIVMDDFEVTVNGVEVTNPISDMLINEGFSSTTVDISSTFTNLGGGTLTYSATTADAGIATAAVSGTTLTITESGIGTTDVIVNADNGSASINETFSIRINGLPAVTSPVADTNIEGIGNIQSFDLSGIFTDPDGDILTFSAVSSNQAAVTLTTSSSNVTITTVAVGVSTITLSADDGLGGISNDPFTVTVSDATGIPESDLGRFMFYPNPITNDLNINFSNREQGMVTLRIISLHGKVLKESLVDKMEVDFNHIWNMSNLPNGQYLLQVITRSALKTVPLFKKN